MEHFQLFMILGILFGNALSVIIPYLRKLAEGKITAFDFKYLYSAVLATVWQSLLMAQVLIDWEAPSGATSILGYIMAIAFGYGGKDFQEQVWKYFRKTPTT